MTQQDIDWEHRITRIEGAIESGFKLQAAETRTLSVEISGMKQQVSTQNGRITTLESWRNFISGLAEGKAQISKSQLAFLAVAGPLLFAGLNLAINYWA